MRRLSPNNARNLALGAQGFADPRPTGRVDVRHFRRVLRRVGVLQLDSVNVLARSHYLPVLARLGRYEQAAFDRYTSSSRELFEYWGHEASLMPSSRHRLFRWRMTTMEPWQSIRRLAAEEPDYVERVYREVADGGPIGVSDLEDAGERTGPWWGSGKGKHALEWLFARGRITAYRGNRFQRLYDLPERVVLPEDLGGEDVPEEEACRELLVLAARHHGIGTARDLADYYRLHIPTARRLLDDLAAAGEIETVEVEGWNEAAFVDPSLSRPRRIEGSALLSPFDSLVWERGRTERLFGFHYRIEIYVPKEKRVYGYYVLPFLLDGELVARVDLKADRQHGYLHVRGAFAEDGRDRNRIAAALAADLETMAAWLDLDRLRVSRNGDLTEALARLV